MGLGMSAQLSSMLGEQPSQLTCTGTSQATAAGVKSRGPELNAQSSQTGALLVSVGLFVPYYVANGTASATSAIVYTPVGSTLNGAASTTGLTIAQNKAAILWEYRKNFWASVLTA
jgi:hypothetical protein